MKPEDYKQHVSKVPVPDEKFEDFYRQFEYVRDIVETDEWKNIYSNYYEFNKYELDIMISETTAEIENYSPTRQMQEIIKCVNSFEYFCHKYIKIAHPIHGLISFIMYEYQRRVIDEYGENRYNILRKFRQGGLTTVSVLWSLWRCLFQKDQQIMVMSKTDREAISAGEIAKRAMQHIPGWMYPQMGKHNDHHRQFLDTGSTLWFHTPEAARGKAITLLIIDEAAFIPDMEGHWRAMYPVIATGGACCVVSTVNGLGNWYQVQYYEAEAGENHFNIIHLHFWEHPEYNDPEWAKETRANLGEKGWKQEVLGDFLGSGETYIAAHIISYLQEYTKDNYPLRQAFPKWRNIGGNEKGAVEWEEGALWIFREPEDGHEYLIGVDCAEGVGEGADNSCFQVVDIATLEQVAEFYSNTCPPHIFSQILNEIGYYYNTALVIIENANQGGAVCSALQHDLAYDNLYYDEKTKNASPGIKPNRTTRPVHLETLQHRLTNNTVKINSRRFVSELNTFIFNAVTKRPEAQKGKHDDAILAMCLTLFVRDSRIRAIPVGAAVPDDMIKIFKTEVYEEIKKEILEGAPEDWLSQDTEDPIFFPDDENVLPGIMLNVKRKNDKLLREFGWIFAPLSLLNYKYIEILVNSVDAFMGTFS